MNEYRILPIDHSYNDQMISIIRGAPINSGLFTVCFDRSPDIFAIPEMKYSESLHLGFFCGDELKGFGSLGFHDALMGGKQEKIFCLYHFYLLPEARGRHFPEKAFEIFRKDISGKANFGYYLALKGNRQVELFIGKQPHIWSPASRIIGDLVVRSIVFSVPRKNRTGYSVRCATLNDIPDIVRLLNKEYCNRDLGHVFDEGIFSRNLQKRRISINDYYLAFDAKGYPSGTCLAWDCSSYRRTRVLNFSQKLFPLLGTYKLLEKIFPMAQLPGEGECFNELTITDYAAENRNPEIIQALLSEIYHRNRNRKYHFMNFGSCSGDILLTATRGFVYSSTISSIVLASFDHQRINYNFKLPFIDIAYL